MLIDARHFMDRIGTADEQPRDREFWSQLAIWQWKKDWLAAEAAGDHDLLMRLDRKYEQILSI